MMFVLLGDANTLSFVPVSDINVSHMFSILRLTQLKQNVDAPQERLDSINIHTLPQASSVGPI